MEISIWYFHHRLPSAHLCTTWCCTTPSMIMACFTLGNVSKGFSINTCHHQFLNTIVHAQVPIFISNFSDPTSSPALIERVAKTPSPRPADSPILQQEVITLASICSEEMLGSVQTKNTSSLPPVGFQSSKNVAHIWVFFCTSEETPLWKLGKDCLFPVPSVRFEFFTNR